MLRNFGNFSPAVQLFASVLLCGSLVSCGGSSGGGSAPAPVVVIDPLAPAGQVDLSAAASLYNIDASGGGGDGGGDGGAAGSAGDGAPIKNAVVTLTDSKGAVVSGRTDSQGQYLLKFKTANFVAPLVLRVVNAGGNVLTSVTDEVAATGKVVRINVNPLTDKITSDVLASSVAGTDKNFDGSLIDKTKLVKAKADLLASVNAALGAAGLANTSAFDPVKSIYAYDGTGVDAVIESLSLTRDPSSGASQLRVKLASLNTAADGTVTTSLVTASTPLASSAVSLPGNPALTFEKITSWITEFNRCLALNGSAFLADLACEDSDGSRIVSSNYKNNSKTIDEDFRVLVSDTTSQQGTSHVPGSSIANPVVLFFSRYSSASTVDDLAVVEVTIRQPRTGVLAGNVGAPIEYSRFLVFKRDDSLTRAKAGNWILHGNQRNYDLSVSPRYFKLAQLNPLKQANTSGNAPGILRSELHIFVSTQKYDAVSERYVSANIRAVRVTGPGLPSAGVVMAPSSVNGASGNLTVHNKTGIVLATTMISSLVTSSFRLAALTDTGAPLYQGFWPAPGVDASYADPPVSDFSTLQAYNRYQFEIFLNSNPGNTTPDAIETARILAPISSPATVLGVALNDLSLSAPLVTPTAASACSFTASWTNNINGGPVNSLYLYAEERSPKGAVSPTTFGVNKWLINASPSDAFLVSNRPSSAPLNCSATPIPSLTNAAGDYRELGIRSTLSRAQYYSAIRWTN